MLPFSKARQLAETWVAVMSDGCAEIVRESVQAKPYGWIFYYQSSEYLRDPTNISAALAGNGPIIVNRVTREVRVLGTTQIEARLLEYERTLPDAILLHAKPETPTW